MYVIINVAIDEKMWKSGNFNFLESSVKSQGILILVRKFRSSYFQTITKFFSVGPRILFSQEKIREF